MKRAEIRAFVEGFLSYRGARLAQAGADLLHVRQAGAPEKDGRLLAFGARAHRANAGSELVAVGSAYLDRMVGEAAAGGRFAVAYQAPPKGKGRKPKGKSLPAVSGHVWGEAVPAYRPLFLFVYLSEYHTIDVPDDLELIPLDPARGQVLSSPGSLLAALRAGRGVPPRGWHVLPHVPTARDLIRSLEAIDRRLQRRARKVKEASAIEIARETANIEAYYRQLIDEARHPVGRSQLSPEEEADRVHALQLDWKRRVQEVSRFWEAYGDVRLSAVGVVMEPCWAFPLHKGGGRRSRRKLSTRCGVSDYRSGRLLEPRCDVCGGKMREGAAVVADNLVCCEHLRAAETEEADGTPRQ